MPLLSDLSDLDGRLQDDLFPRLARELGPLTSKQQHFVTVLEMAPVGAFLTACPGLPGRPAACRSGGLGACLYRPCLRHWGRVRPSDDVAADRTPAFGQSTALVVRLGPRPCRAERGDLLARLKEEFGGRSVRVRGHAKVMCHLMFGILVLAASQLLCLVT